MSKELKRIYEEIESCGECRELIMKKKSDTCSNHALEIREINTRNKVLKQVEKIIEQGTYEESVEEANAVSLFRKKILDDIGEL